MVQSNDSNALDSSSPSDRGFDGSVAEAVVTAVAEATGRSPLEMEPISSVVDPDAVNAIFDGPNDRHTSVTVAFTYCGEHVTVTADGIRLDRADSAEE